MRLIFSILFTVTLALATPVDRKNGPMVVDIPAGMFSDDTEVDTGIPMSSITEDKDAEVIRPPVTSVSDSTEDVDKKTGIDEDGYRVPTIFVIRRPVFNDRFPFFQSSPFFGSSSIFENRRPFFERPSFQERNPPTVSSEDSDHVMLTHMEQMMKRMQQQMSSLFGSFATPSLHRRPLRPIFPSLSFGSGEDISGGGSAENETVLDIDNLPANYSNSTSETKLVDGHVVQVNKTIHKISSGDNNRGFFHFEVINVRPTDEPKTDTPTPEAPTVDVKPAEIPEPVVSVPTIPDVPIVEDPTINEVGETKTPSTPEQEKDTFPYFVNNGEAGRSVWEDEEEDRDRSQEVEWIPSREYEYESLPPVRGARSSMARSLSDDLRVNRLMEEQRMLSPYLILNPDVELFDV